MDDQTTLMKEIEQLEEELLQKKERLRLLRSQLKGNLVDNYTFQANGNKEVSLLELFGDKSELIVIHNMGKSCSYCTMWADGFNSVYHHIVEKAAFVVISPDSPEIQEDVAAERSWVFPMVSSINNTFKEDMGFKKENLNYPGVSVFTKDDHGNIYHHTRAPFGPGDEYCVVWSLFDLLPSGYEDYRPSKKINKTSPFQLTNNVAVQVKNYEKALEFYKNTLGFTLVEKDDVEAKLSINGVNFYMENAPEGTTTFFEFAVDNVEEVKNLLLNEGCIISKEYSSKSFMIKDPYGLNFHIFEGT